MRRPRPAVEDDQRRWRVRVVGAQVAGDAIPGFGRLVADVEPDRALAYRHVASLAALGVDRRCHVLADLARGECAVVDPDLVDQSGEILAPDRVAADP